ncbi:ATP-dependent DNA ligase [Patulibacter medicamentivorans]|uniref:ATP-dependent DNA ligase n=1 Tax=Patulibacter medicamentivorans TaxID=1097667 RepID=H0E8E8_9ACTN|nr:non-homologous end-joining DNA ligase [Patulibacter medicamentivorans]EHN10038.1 ATP-dependent DNA ligase [Patulibacter medicamentivorans]
MAKEETTIEVAGRPLRLSSPSKAVFPARADRADGLGPERAITKLDLAEYYLAVADAALVHLRERPGSLKRFPDGVAGKPFFQKRIADSAPDWLETAVVTFPSGRQARELVIADAAHLLWAVQMGVVDFNPWPVRRADLDRPDELRIDLDPEPGVGWDVVRQVALVVKQVLEDHGLVGFPKTSGSRGIHVNVRIRPEHDFVAVRRAAIALAREVERRAPGRATSKWWKEEREGVFLDYNQNARDRTVASAWSVRPTPDARVSMPLTWEQVPDAELEDFRLDTVPALLAEHGDPHAAIDDHAGSLDRLLGLSREDEEQRGLGDAPWPPNYAKQPGEPKRVQPSRARKQE